MLGLCDRFHALPSAVMAEDADLLRMIKLEQHGKPAEGGEQY